MATTRWIFGNDAASTCPSPLTNSQTAIVLASSASFPIPAANEQFMVRIDDTGNPGSSKVEYAICTANNTGTGTLTVTRGQDGTTGQTFLANATIRAVLSMAMLAQSGGAFSRMDTRFKARATQANVQSVPTGAWTKITLDTIDFDPNSNWDVVTNRRWTCPASGIYLVSFRFSVASLVNASNGLQAGVYKNGTLVIPGAEVYGYSSVGSDAIALVAGDYLELWGYQASGGAINTGAGGASTSALALHFLSST